MASSPSESKVVKKLFVLFLCTSSVITAQSQTAPHEQFILQLHNIGAFKFGDFTLKSDRTSPIYVNLRPIISHPDMLRELAELIWQKIEDVPFDCVCGVPYTGIPIATALSVAHNLPMIMKRKEAKSYGTKQLIEGDFAPGTRCLLIEDIITSGASIMETITPLEEAGIVITDIVVIIDREQEGKHHVESHGYQIHTLWSLSELLAVLRRHVCIDADFCYAAATGQ